MRKFAHSLFTLLLVVVFSQLASCASSTKRYTYPAKQQITWPASPAKPRIKYIGSFSSAEDIGIEKGFFTLLAEMFIGSEEQRLIRPMAVVVVGESNIFVADPGIKGVHYFNTKDQIYKQIRLNGDLPMPSPVAFTIDSNQQVLVSDSALGKIFMINKEAGIAEPVNLQYSLEQPTGLAYDRKRKQLYVVDTAKHQVNIYDQYGKRLKIFGKRGNAKAEFNYPTYLWQDSKGHIWVTDSLNFRVQQFTASGKYIGQFGQLGNVSGHFSRPKGVATDNFGHIYIVDSLLHALQIFDKKARLLLTIGRQGTQAGEFWLPSGIFIGENSKVYIADSHNQRIQVFQYIGGRS